MVFILSLLGLFLLLVSSSLILMLAKDIHALVAYFAFSIGIGCLSLAWCVFPIPLVLSLAGIVSGVLLGFSIMRTSDSGKNDKGVFQFSAFRLLFLFLALAVSLSLYSETTFIFSNAPLALLLPTLFIILLGLFQIGLSERPYRLGMSLLTISQGFSLLYSWMEASMLVVGLCALVLLALAFTFSFYEFQPALESRETSP
jgi:hypothetical protein